MTYYVYILTNKNKSVFYVGFTNNIYRRLKEHENGFLKGFTQKYNCHYLVYYEKHDSNSTAIAREKQIKKFSRKKKVALINSFNPEWKFLNKNPGL